MRQVRENECFTIVEICWVDKANPAYVLKNERAPLLENLVQKTEVMDVHAGEFKRKAKRLRATMEKRYA